MNWRRIALIISGVILVVTAFIYGLWVGRQVAVSAIKSELVWHNQYVLEEAIEDMKNGNVESAERKIRQVNEELEKMKRSR